MRRLFKKFSLNINLSIVASIISSISIIASAFIGNNGSIDKAIQVLFPLVFWLGLIAEQVFIWNANSIRNMLEAGANFVEYAADPVPYQFYKQRKEQ